MSWWIAQTVVVTVLLAAAIELAARVLRLRPAVRHVLWLIVLAKLVTPPVVVLNWPWASALPPAIEAQVLKAPPSVATTEWLLSHPSGTPGVGAVQIKPVSITLAYPTFSPAHRSSSSASLANLVSLLLAVWALGALAFAMVQGLRIGRVRRVIRSGLPAEPALVSIAERLAERLSLAAPRLIVAPVNSPFVWAINPRRPVVLWPAGMAERTPESHVRALLLHELAHVKRGDHWTGWLELTAGAIWWWNPLFWHARTRLRESAELACDQWVIAECSAGRRDYAEALLDLCDRSNTPPLNAVGISVDGRRFLKRRLIMIMRGPAPVRLSRVAVAASALIAVSIAPAWGRSGGDQTASLARDEATFSNPAGRHPAPRAESPGNQPQRTVNPGSIRETLFTAGTPETASPAEAVEASIDRAWRLKTSSAPAQSPSGQQPVLPPKETQSQRLDPVAIAEQMRVALERLRAVSLERSLRSAGVSESPSQIPPNRQIGGLDIRLSYLDLVYAQRAAESARQFSERSTTFIRNKPDTVVTGAGDQFISEINRISALSRVARERLVEAERAFKLLLTAGDVSHPIWNIRLSVESDDFPPSTTEISTAVSADVEQPGLEAALKAAALDVQAQRSARGRATIRATLQQDIAQIGGKTTAVQVIEAQRELSEATQNELAAVLRYRKAEAQLNAARASR